MSGHSEDVGADVGTDDASSGKVVTRHAETGEDEPVSRVVVKAVAEARGISPVDIRQPLYEAVDPDALDRIFTGATDQFDGQLSFTFNGCEITVTADQSVLVEPIS